jgi:inorganic phosphate transporter, PiT family
MFTVLCVILAALAFEYVNGFHDTANAIATTVSTKVLSPRQAVILAAVFNLLGALAGTAVATTIGNGLLDNRFVTLGTIFCALIGGLVWNLATWWYGLPSSSSHALIGSLCGATLASAKGDLSVIRWSVLDPGCHVREGLWPKVIAPMFLSPLVGIIAGFILMGLLLVWLHGWTPGTVNRSFGRLQLLSASWMSYSHGTNDAQKTMGIIALTLFTATKSGVFDHLPPGLKFLHAAEFHVPVWVKVICALTMAAGTAAGGWRIIKTVGHKMVKLQPVHGFAAQTTAATVIQMATHLGIPLSTTHVITASIMGVGATKRLNAVKWGVVGNMAGAWFLTLPLTALLGYMFFSIFRCVSSAP